MLSAVKFVHIFQTTSGMSDESLQNLMQKQLCMHTNWPVINSYTVLHACSYMCSNDAEAVGKSYHRKFGIHRENYLEKIAVYCRSAWVTLNYMHFKGTR